MVCSTYYSTLATQKKINRAERVLQAWRRKAQDLPLLLEAAVRTQGTHHRG